MNEHAQARRNFHRRKVEMRDIDDTWQADLVETLLYSQSGKYVTNAIKSIFEEVRIPKNLQSDKRKEFYNYQFNILMKRYKINFILFSI